MDINDLIVMEISPDVTVNKKKKKDEFFNKVQYTCSQYISKV